MLKKLFKASLLASVMMMSGSVFAQETRPDFPRVGFWSNWSLGGDIVAGYQSGVISRADWNMQDADRDGSWGWGINLMAQKQLNYKWALRFTLGAPRALNFSALGSDSLAVQADHADRYMAATVGAVYSFLGGRSYTGETRSDFYGLVNFGTTFKHEGRSFSSNATDYGNFALYAEIGLGYSVRICENSKLFVEATYANCADIVNPLRLLPNRTDPRAGEAVAFLGFGYMYNFGLTATDAEIVAQKAKLTQENFDALNNQVSNLESEVANSKNAEQKLQNQINDLENQLEAVKNANTAAADSLQKIIDQIKEDQLTFYALPFSVLFNIDSYKVSGVEKTKVKAIAKVMQDNPDTKFVVVGFCDHTGSDEYNMKLSQKRAEAVKDMLVSEYGIAADRLECDWKGKTVAYGDLKLSINRRVSFYRVIE